MSSRLCCNQIQKVNEKALSLHQLINANVESKQHNHCLAYQEESASYIPKTCDFNEIENVDADIVPSHNELLVWDEKMEKPDVHFLAQSSQHHCRRNNSHRERKIHRKPGIPALTDMVMFADTLTSGYTMGIGSCGDGSVIFKRRPTDADFCLSP